MIVTTTHGRYLVEEEQPGEFLITLLAGHDNLPTDLLGGVPGTSGVRRAPLTLGVGIGWCYDRHNVQQVACDCNRIVSIEP